MKARNAYGRPVAVDPRDIAARFWESAPGRAIAAEFRAMTRRQRRRADWPARVSPALVQFLTLNAGLSWDDPAGAREIHSEVMTSWPEGATT